MPPFAARNLRHTPYEVWELRQRWEKRRTEREKERKTSHVGTATFDG